MTDQMTDTMTTHLVMAHVHGVRDASYAMRDASARAGKKVSVTNSLRTLAPEVAAQWHPIKNKHLTPGEVHTRMPRAMRRLMRI